MRIATSAETARKTRAVASQRSVRRVSPGSAGARNRQTSLSRSAREDNRISLPEVAAVRHLSETWSHGASRVLGAHSPCWRDGGFAAVAPPQRNKGGDPFVEPPPRVFVRRAGCR